MRFRGSEWEAKVGRHKTSYSSMPNITKRMAESMEQISRNRAGWRISVLIATRAADHHS